MQVYLFSDGFHDQIGGENRKRLTSKNFKNILIENHLKLYEEQKESLQSFFKNWIGKVGKQLDDVMVLGIKINFRA